MKFTFLMYAFFVSGSYVYGQISGDAMDAAELNDSATYYFDRSNFDKANEFAQVARLKAEEFRQPDELYRTYSLLGGIEFRKGRLKSAKRFHQHSLDLASEAGNNNWRARSLSNLASVLSAEGNYDSAYVLLNQIIELKEVEESTLIAVYGRLGVNLKRQQQYDKAIGYYIKSLTLSQSLKDSLNSARTLANIGNIYMEQKEPSRALDHYLQALALLDSAKHGLSISGISMFAADALQAQRRYDEAEKILRRSLALVERLNLPGSQAYALESLGSLYYNRREPHRAIAAFEESRSIYETMDAWSNLESVLLSLSTSYLRVGELTRAEQTIEEALAIAREHRHAIGLASIYKQLSRVDSAKGNFKDAFLHHQLAVHYNDSLFTVDKVKAVEEVNRKFEAEQKGRIIEEQKRVIDQQNAKEILGMTIAGFTILSLMIVFVFLQRRKKLRHKVEMEQQQKENLLTIVIAQEQMQQKIARDLHDGFAQLLGAAKIKLESTKAMAPSPSFAGEIEEVAETIDRACHDVRAISHQLLPYSLEKYGLVEAIEELLETYRTRQAQHFTFTNDAEAGKRDPNVEINLYRIIQELLNNIIKHADASRVQIHLSQHAGEVLLTVNDNGKGFDPKRTSFGAGLMNIETRLQSMGGTLRIASMSGEGTTTIIQIPVS